MANQNDDVVRSSATVVPSRKPTAHSCRSDTGSPMRNHDVHPERLLSDGTPCRLTDAMHVVDAAVLEPLEQETACTSTGLEPVLWQGSFHCQVVDVTPLIDTLRSTRPDEDATRRSFGGEKYAS